MKSPHDILCDALTIAVVGASRDPGKAAHRVPAELLAHGWRVIPVNPFVDEIWGERAYPVLAEVPEPVDLVNVFRPAPQATEVVRQAIEIGAHAVWLQLGITSSEGRELATAAGLDYVEDTCIKVVRAAGNLTRRAA